MLDPCRGAIAAMLDDDAEVAATMILEHLRKDGFPGGTPFLKATWPRSGRFSSAARSFQRTTYLPGEIGHTDWWEPPARVPVGKGPTRKLYALVATLPHSAAHAAMFTPLDGNASLNWPHPSAQVMMALDPA